MNTRQHALLYPIILSCIIAAIPSSAAAQPLLNPDNGHYYEFVSVPPRHFTWSSARDAAAARSWNGYQGYLATITLAEEDRFIQSNFGQYGDVWIGASDATVEGEWRWVTGPEAIADGGRGQLFWRGGTNGTAVGFENWQPGEPNNLGAEDYAAWRLDTRRGGRNAWNDFPNEPIYDTDIIAGYLVEYGGTQFEMNHLIASGTTWSFLDNGTNQGTAWRTLGFDESAWSRGPSQLGYGDGDETTLVDCGPGPVGNCSPANGLSNNYPTTYFRISGEFDADYLATIEGLSAQIMRDDGAAVYVNGVEVYRDASLRPDAAYNELANYNGAGAVGGTDENAWTTFAIAPSLFRDGLNVIAVEVHQQALNSSDVSFDFELTALVATVPEPATESLIAVAFALFGLLRVLRIERAGPRGE